MHMKPNQMFLVVSLPRGHLITQVPFILWLYPLLGP